MELTDFAIILGAGSIGLLVFAVALFLLIPSIRKKENKAVADAALSIKYAKEIASGDAVIIVKDQNAYKTIALYLVYAGLAMLVIRKIQHYIDDLTATCTPLWGMNSFFIEMLFLQCAGFTLAISMVWASFKSYRKTIEDGYSPPRSTRGFPVDKIAFKLTPKIKRKLQLGFVGTVIYLLFFLSIPSMWIITMTNGRVYDWDSLKSVNYHAQVSCLADLKDRHNL